MTGATLRAILTPGQVLFSTVSSSGTWYVKFACQCLSFCQWLIGTIGGELSLENGLVDRMAASRLQEYILLLWVIHVTSTLGLTLLEAEALVAY